MKTAYLKDLFRSIGRSKARFFSIMVIIAIGVGFYAGINATEPDMILSADKYYKSVNLSDLRIYNPLGFSKEDLDDIRQIKGVKTIQEGFYKDVFLTTEEGNTYTVRLYSYDPADYKDGNGLNIPQLSEGRFPENIGEIVIESGKYAPNDIFLDEKVTLSVPEGENFADSISSDTFYVVGKAESPLYISFERGQTHIGDGSIDFYGFIHENNFTLDEVTEIYIKTEDSEQFLAYTEEYVEYLKPIQKNLEELGIQAVARETESLWEDLEQVKRELEEGKIEAEEKFQEAEQDLFAAEEELKNAEEELLAEEEKAWSQIQEAEVELEKGKIQLRDGWELYKNGLSEWEQGVSEYENHLSQLEKVKIQLDEKRPLIEESRIIFNELKKQLQEGEKMLAETEKVVLSVAEFQAIMKETPPHDSNSYLSLVNEKIVYPPQLKETLLSFGDFYSPDLVPTILYVTNEAYGKLGTEFDRAKTELENGKLELTKLENILQEYDQGVAQYEEGMKQLHIAKLELDAAKQQLDQSKRELEANEEKILQGEKELDANKEKLTTNFASARQELEEAKKELSEGWQQFEEEKRIVFQQLEDAEKEIWDAEKELNRLPSEWFVQNRDGNPGYSGYGDDTKRIGAVAKVFPLFFFLVAALVCLTTMTRMVEEERIQIGTLKALGYGAFSIASKYLIYAFLSSFLGTILGLCIGYQLFPRIIMNAYGIMYNIPERVVPFHWEYAIISLLLALVTTIGAALMSTIHELRATPAVLMQPRAPKPGKRIFLERIQPLWSRLSFSQKVTARNIFRYKKRFYMTVLGISGCTALLITGFGLRDSINDIMGKQFEEIFLYDGQIIANTEIEGYKVSLFNVLNNDQRIESFMSVLNETVEAKAGNVNRLYEANLLIPQSPKIISEFVDLHTRVEKGTIEIPKEGAVITEKLAKLLDVVPGDSMTIRSTEGMNYEVEVVEIAENYLTHYIYMSPSYYEMVTGESFSINSVLFNAINMDQDMEASFKEDLMENDSILGVVLLGSIADNFADTIKSLDFVVFVLILSAGALAIVVLYNLTNINITERIREIATIKVLGFREREVDAYVYRENIILTLFGTLLGLLLGILLHKYVISTMEIDSMMFGQQVHGISFLWSVLLTFAFSGIVNWFMHYKLKKVNMVESLKSIE